MKRTIKRFAASALALCLAASLTACGSAPVSEHSGKTEPLAGQQSAPAPKAEALTGERAAALTELCLRLTEKSIKTGENGLVSPLSVLTALGMTMNGAEGETLSEMEAVFSMDADTLNRTLYSYWNTLPESDSAHLYPANSIWFTNDQRFSVREAFLNTCEQFYDAELFKTPMDDTTCREINGWVREKTEDMIPEILDEIPQDAVMYLINALAFEGKWKEPYEPRQVQEGVFLTESGMPVKTDLLYSEEGFYLENDLAKGVFKEYAGGEYAFAGLLPKDGRTVEELLQALDGAALQELLQNREAVPVQTILPKFDTEYAVEMSAVLEALGMPRAFDSQKAEFSGLGSSAAGNIYINRVLHKTFLSLTAEGTRAAAATVIEANDECAPAEPEEFREVFLDQPFLYLILDTKTCVPVFIGTMNDPTGETASSEASPLLLKINDTLYQSTGQPGFEGPRCGTLDGTIRSSVKAGEAPRKNDQSNFGTGWGYQGSGERIEVNLGRHWIVFEAVSE